MKTIFSGIFAAIIPTRATFYFIVASFVAGALTAGYISHEFHSLETTTEVNTARAKESGLAVISNKHEANLIAKLKQDNDDANKRANLLQALLKSQPACRVDPAIVRLLNPERLPDNAGIAARVETTTAPNQTVDSNQVIAWAADNINTVCKPNADQLAEVIAYYDDVRACINSRNFLDKRCGHLHNPK